MLINMANEMAHRGHRIFVVIADEQGPYRDKLAPAVDIRFLGKRRVVGALWPLIRFLRNERIDILYSAMTYVNIIAVLARSLSGSRKTGVIISERNFFSFNARGNGEPPTIFQKLCVFLIYPFADRIIGISKGVADDISRYMAFGKRRVSHIYNPVVTHQMLDELKQTGAVDISVPEIKPLLVTSARMVPQKDQVTLIRAFADVLKTREASLLLLGEGPLRPEIESLAANLGIKDNVYFAGFVKNPLSYMKQADIFVMSSAWEGFCNVIVEALLCGLPVVSTDCPSGPAEILDNGAYGALVPVGDSEAMGAAILKTLQFPHNGIMQKQRALEFSVEKICDQYETLFSTVTTEKVSA